MSKQSDAVMNRRKKESERAKANAAYRKINFMVPGGMNLALAGVEKNINGAVGRYKDA